MDTEGNLIPLFLLTKTYSAALSLYVDVCAIAKGALVAEKIACKRFPPPLDTNS